MITYQRSVGILCNAVAVAQKLSYLADTKVLKGILGIISYWGQIRESMLTSIVRLASLFCIPVLEVSNTAAGT